jgi:hypothetical protein
MADAARRFDERVPRETVDEQARRKNVRPITATSDLARDDIWESDQELDAFLDHIYRSRHADNT